MRVSLTRCGAALRCVARRAPQRHAQPPPPPPLRSSPALHAQRWRTACSGANTSSFASGAPALLRVRLLRVTGADVDALSDALLGVGALSVSVEDAAANSASETNLYRENASTATPGGDTWALTHVTALFTDADAWDDARPVAESALHGRDLSADGAVTLDNALDEDWEAAIRAEYRPLLAATSPDGRDIWIVPDWFDDWPRDKSKVNIILEPGLAFGTGEHPTTRLCLRWLSETLRTGDLVMDYGSGSGVLAIGALKLGASHAVATDVDALAVRAAGSNAVLNEVEARLHAVHVGPALSDPLPTWQFYSSRGRFDGSRTLPTQGGAVFQVVVANILLGPLLDLAPRLAWYCKLGGRVGLSGLLATQAPAVIAAYAPYFDALTWRTEGEWALVEGVRNATPAEPGGTRAQ